MYTPEQVTKWIEADPTENDTDVPVDIAVRRERIAVCEGCPRLNEDYLCQECGCFMPAKVRGANQSCPLDKWPS